MFSAKANGAIAAGLLLSVFLWGGSNAGVKYLVGSWPPIWVGGTRFLCAGLLLLAVLRWTKWLGAASVLPPGLKHKQWLGGGLSLAVYIVAFNWALRYTATSHVVLYLGAAPVWALLWEGRPEKSWTSVKRYGAAALALAGVFVLFRPALKTAHSSWVGECLGLLASVLWTNYGRQCRALGTFLSGPEITAHTMWRAGAWLMPLGLVEAAAAGLVWRADLLVVQTYCVVASGVISYALWSNALRHWPTSQVYLFNNLIPLSTVAWASVWLGEAVTPTFWLAMVLIVAGVVLGQTNWQRILGTRWLPTE